MAETLDFMNFIRRKMSELFGYPIVQGMTIDELHVKPTTEMVRNFYNLLVQKQTIDNIDNWQQMTESDMDLFGAKFFMKRISGDMATGSVRVWVDVWQDYFIGTDFRALGKDGTQYAALIPGLTKAQSLTTSTDSYGKYYFDVRVYSVAIGPSFNKSAGQIINISGIDFSFKFVTNPEPLTNGTTRETNEEYYNRLKYALNDRSMSNKRSLYAGLMERFPVIHSMYIAGAGDRYMTRDLLQAVDLSQPKREATFLGKTQLDNTIRHAAFYGTFPPEPWSRGASYRNPLSISSDFQFPQTVEAVDLTNDDPAYHGYPIYQEATDDMYRGLYHDDFVRFMRVLTVDLVNITDDVIGNGGVTTPPPGWYVGAHGKSNGDFGLPETVTSEEIIKFTDLSDITIVGGAATPVAAMKDIKKRVGVKVSGRITTPVFGDSNARSSIQVSIGGKLLPDPVNGNNIINAFSGIGFGIYIISAMDESAGSILTNAVVFFTNNTGIESGVTYQNQLDGVGFVTAMVERSARIMAGSEYDFEFVIHGDVSLSLRLTPVSDNGANDGLTTPMVFTPAQDSVLVREFANNQNSDSYGSYCVVALDSKSNLVSDAWKVKRMRAVDLTPHRPHALFMFNVDGLEEPMELVFRGYGQGYSKSSIIRGHGLYIWNIETKGKIQGKTLLSSGGWERLGDASDDNAVDSVSVALTQRLSGIDRYVVSTRYGRVIIVMAVCNGTSHAGLIGGSDSIGDVNAALVIDYIKLKDQQVDAFHGNHKADIYVNTLRNVDDLRLVTAQLLKGNTSDYFVISAATGQSVPVADIVNIIDTNSNNILQPSQYSVSRRDAGDMGSARDVVYINAPGFSAITVNYHTYPDITSMQDYFDGRNFGNIIGDYLVRHKIVAYIDLGFSYSGNTAEADLAISVREYFDASVGRVFNVDDMLNYLFINGYVSNVGRPISASYETVDSTGRAVTGTISTQIEISDVQFFRIRNMTLTRIGG